MQITKYTEDSSRIIWCKDLEHSILKMEIATKVISIKICDVVKESTFPHSLTLNKYNTSRGTTSTT